MKPSDTPLERIIITGQLQVCSPLRIGDGALQLPGSAGKASPRTLLRDAKGRPYIPGSTLRGYLSNQLRRHPAWEKELENLFGSPPKRSQPEGSAGSDGKQKPLNGALRVYDATWNPSPPPADPQGDGLPGQPGERIESRIAIDPVTATARPNHLLTEEVVAPGSAFSVRLEADRVDQSHLEALLGALHSLDGQIMAQLGQGKTLGRGLLRWRKDLQQVKTLTKADFQDWLSLPWKPETLKKDYLKEKVDYQTWQPDPASQEYLKLDLRLHARAPILIADPQRKTGKKGEPDHRFTIEGDTGSMRVPASTLKGMLRGRARKILMTLVDVLSEERQQELSLDQWNEITDSLLKQLFGNTDRISWLRVSDGACRIEKDEIHQQQFNAIDRFTGGVADKRLYLAEAVYPKKPINASITLDPAVQKQENRWMLGLLLHVLRDAMEGDLAIGWGKAKGYGVIQAEIADTKDWLSQWTELFEPQSAFAGFWKTGQEALETKILLALDQRQANSTAMEVSAQ